MAEVPDLEPRTVLTAASARLTVKLTREVLATEDRQIDLARAISAVAREHGATADRTAVQEVQLDVAASPMRSISASGAPSSATSPSMADDSGIDPRGQGSTVWMQDLDPAKPLRHAMLIDVSVAREHAEARMQAAFDAGARVVDDSAAQPPGSWPIGPEARSGSPPGPMVRRCRLATNHRDR